MEAAGWKFALHRTGDLVSGPFGWRVATVCVEYVSCLNTMAWCFSSASDSDPAHPTALRLQRLYNIATSGGIGRGGRVAPKGRGGTRAFGGAFLNPHSPNGKPPKRKEVEVRKA